VDELRARSPSVLFAVRHDSESFAGFVRVIPGELARVISNILVNSMDAMAGRDRRGRIDCAVETSGQRIVLQIVDDGCGIPRVILPRVFQKDFSYGKHHGTGLGLHQVRATVEAAGGSVAIDSIEVQGTTVSVSLPLVDPPKWFFQGLRVTGGTEICICDDESVVHDIWAEKMSSVRDLIGEITVRNFREIESFAAWMSQPANASRPFLVMMDLDFPGESMDGIEVLTRFGIESRACLVTGSRRNRILLNRCIESSVALLPKSLLARMPVERVPMPDSIDVVLLEDDPWTSESWMSEARESGKSLWLPRDASELWSGCGRLDRATPIYIDENLGLVRGGAVVLDLMRCGFQNVHLATGYRAEDMHARYPGVSVVGKDWPLNL